MSQDSARIALAARIHVLLRRKTGRVTDTDRLGWPTRSGKLVLKIALERVAAFYRIT